jgi:hypothetical protein
MSATDDDPLAGSVFPIESGPDAQEFTLEEANQYVEEFNQNKIKETIRYCEVLRADIKEAREAAWRMAELVGSLSNDLDVGQGVGLSLEDDLLIQKIAAWNNKPPPRIGGY